MTDPMPPTPDGRDSQGRDYVNVDKDRYLMFANLLLKQVPFNPSRGKIKLLDVGCGGGFVVKAAKDQGFEAIGIDTYGDAINYGKKVLKAPVQNINLYNYKPKEKFDVITLNHVFEHITETEKFLKNIKGLMKKDGVLLLSSPNYKSLMRMLFGDRWYGFQALQHVWQLTPKSLKKYLESQGFTNIKFYPSSMDYNPPNIIKNAVFRILNLGAKQIGLGDQLVMTASKRAE